MKECPPALLSHVMEPGEEPDAADHFQRNDHKIAEKFKEAQTKRKTQRKESLLLSHTASPHRVKLPLRMKSMTNLNRKL